MKLILSTSNIMSAGPSVIRRPIFEKSNTELTSSLRENFSAHQKHISGPNQTNGTTTPSKHSFRTWTTQREDALYIPTHTPSPLTEPREAYDITVKLFYLPNIPASRRCVQTREAIDLVLRELGSSSIDLLIVSFPGISFDADDEEDSDFEDDMPASNLHSTITQTSTSLPASIETGSCEDSSTTPDPIPTMLETWRTLESLHTSGLISRLGVAEFGVSRLSKFLPHTTVRPSVDQINVKDCCVVPKPLILYAKKEGIELLTHNDCTNVLPRGTLREILGKGQRGVGVLDGEEGVNGSKDGEGEGLRGDVEPQWVVKYTAVVKDRGVVESKGYFAVAELREGQ
ncbi:glutamate-cysteine ligase modifier subunit [Delitschia confertaspora ATCC 74209]|uniref:GCS light chain n=1 Tax=Delitschia confertaspora ATCC 74209 TaxID=1513339 RepID=A0A9P4MSM2_9PLEO|nr:glutamate-cysteine ligase modifier subunit [Delitschia confertaspora ATCC 74209]